uniref:Reverse transcriptase domain-containing protein n=1 Tax=Tanacetum cinerariifolium TaxID=118510 RepID=A0A6L2JRY9_TANCI|nr:reverse transcriptase domain-containing protein [Tanacetum cinerariifolium]
MTKTKSKPNWLRFGGSKTDERLRDDTFADQRKSARQTHIHKSRLQADPCLTRVSLRPTNRNYHQLLPIIAEKVHQEKVHQEKLKAIKARINFEEASQYSESGTPSRRMSLKERLRSRHVCSMSGSPEPRRGHSESPRKRDPEIKTVFKRLEKESIPRKLPLAKKCIKDPVEIHNIKQRDGESTEEFLRRGEVVASNREQEKSFPSWKQQEARHKQNFEKGGFRNQQRPEQKGKLRKCLKQKIVTFNQRIKAKQWKRPDESGKKGEDLRKGKIAGNTDGEEDGTEGTMISEAEMRGHFVHRMYVDGGSSLEILYEHFFNKFRLEVRSQMVPATTPLVGFSGEIIWPLNQISLLAKIGDEEHSTSAWMNFMVVRSPSPYNGIIGRSGVRRIQVVPSTAHGMLNFSVIGRTVTLRSSRIIQLECTMVSGPEVPQPIINQVTKENIQKPADMTRVPHHIAEHNLNIREGCLPVRQKKGQAPERNKAIYEEVKKLVDAETVLSFPSPKCLKDVQRLNGKLASLNRFLSKSAKKSLPFFKTLKKCTKKEELVIYLAAAKEAVSAVLMTESDEKQMLIYFVIRALQGPEINYTPKEKLILALILADFILEHLEDDLPDTPMKDKEEFSDPWILFINGSSCIDGPEAGLIITNSERMKFTYALRFMFHATNNEAECEALIDGLRIAEQMGVKNLQANVDSKLVANQMREQKRRCAEQDGIHQLRPPNREEILLEEKRKVRIIRRKAGRYAVTNIILYKRSFLGPWLRCVGPLQANYVLREIHEGSCSMHAGPRSVVAKALRSGYYWPTMHADARKLIRECNSCQEAKSKAMMEKYYNVRVHNTSFKPGDLVYQSNEASHAKEGDKLGPMWEEPYEVTEALGKGAYKLRDCNRSILPRTWNVFNLKKCYMYEM